MKSFATCTRSTELRETNGMRHGAREAVARHGRIAIMGFAVIAGVRLAACTDVPVTQAPAPGHRSLSLATAPGATSCPAGLPEGASCYTGSGESGARYLIAIPGHWDGTLVLFNRSATPIPLTNPRALGPAYPLMSEGIAFAASDYQGTVLAADAANRTEELRQIFVATFGKPRRTAVYGASFGGLATARCMELYGVNEDGSRNYDGALAGCGPLAGTLVASYTRLDLRVVYQYYCRNHPRPFEPQYPLYLGLAPEASMMSADDLRQRIDECTGLTKSPDARSEEQQRKLTNILEVLRIPENELLAVMNGATNGLRELVQGKLGGHNPFPNVHVHYRGSDDDVALNHEVERYESDHAAVAALEAADTPTGHVVAPVVTMHTIEDGRAFVEHEWTYRHIFQRAGTKELLFQTYTNGGPHCAFSTPEWMATLTAVLRWIDTGTKPTAHDVMSACEWYQHRYGGTCTFDPTYKPHPFGTRIYPRRP